MLPTPKRGDVYWVAFDPSIGGEAQKTRPAIILSNDQANRRLNRVLVIPLTSNTGRVFQGEAMVTLNGKPHKAIASQMTTASELRIGDKFGSISQDDMWLVENAVIFHTGLNSDDSDQDQP